MPVDLHTHTTHSDGSLSPTELVALARKKNLSAIAITDHDILSANKEASTISKDLELKVIAGVELSVDFPLPQMGHLHIVGLFIDPENNDLNKALSSLRNNRLKRNQNILNLLKKLNKEVTADELNLEAGVGSIGRPHIAEAMMKKGYVKSRKEAFDLYLQKGAPAYVDRMRLPADQAIELIHQAGGITILAHPQSLGYKSLTEAGDTILKLKNLGLDGIEVYNSGQDSQLTTQKLTFAREHHLVVSGGSDFHGNVKPEFHLGSANVPDWVYEELVNYRI